MYMLINNEYEKLEQVIGGEFVDPPSLPAYTVLAMYGNVHLVGQLNEIDIFAHARIAM